MQHVWKGEAKFTMLLPIAPEEQPNDSVEPGTAATTCTYCYLSHLYIVCFMVAVLAVVSLSEPCSLLNAVSFSITLGTLDQSVQLGSLALIQSPLTLLLSHFKAAQ